MFVKVAVLLVACLVQVNCEWEYCKCMESPTEFQEKYDHEQSAYFKNILGTQANVLRDYSSEFAAIGNMQKCTNSYYNQPSKDLTLDLLILCGGFPLRDHYFANWASMPTPSDICNYISINGPQVSALTKTNLAAVQNCNFDNVVKDILYKEFDQCEVGCPAKN